MKVLSKIFLLWGTLQFIYYVLLVTIVFGYIDVELFILAIAYLSLVDARSIGGFGGLGVILLLSICTLRVGFLLNPVPRRFKYIVFYLSVLLAFLVTSFVIRLGSVPLEIDTLFDTSSGFASSMARGILEMRIVLALEIAFVTYAFVKIYQHFKKSHTRNKKEDNVKIEIVSICFILLIVLKMCFDLFIADPKSKYNVSYGTKITHQADATVVLSEEPWSPGHTFLMEDTYTPSIVTFRIKKPNGKVFIEKSYYYAKHKEDGVEVGCVCAVSFKGWKDDSTFVIRTMKEDGSVYEDVVDITKTPSVEYKKFLMGVYNVL